MMIKTREYNLLQYEVNEYVIQNLITVIRIDINFIRKYNYRDANVH